ncbi:MAG TPA: ATP-binding protein [Rhizomicrobium sp.]|jgi:signal transduction histidine kinase|nr:ATP-binding protein [Rhizomicrobium sp.]
MPSKHVHIRPVVIILASIFLLGAAIYAGLMAFAHVGDAHQRDIEERIIESALGQHRMKLEGMIVQQAYWDTAYDAVGPDPDMHWLDENLGFSAELGGVPATLIFDEQARRVYRFAAHKSQRAKIPLPPDPTLTMVVREALGHPALPPVPVTSFVRHGNKIFLASAQRIVPNDARATRPLAKHYVLVYLLPVDAAMRRRLQTGFEVALPELSRAADDQLAHVALTDITGQPLGFLNWRPARPGREFANQIAPVALGCFFLLAAMQLVVLYWWMQVARRIEEEGRARASFLANASHELRTPLNAIIGFSDCMVGEMFGPLSARYREYAGDIKTSGQLLLGIVNDVLDLTQLNGVAEIAMQPLNAGEALAGAIRMLREFAKDDDIRVDFVDRSNGAEVLASEKLLCQILLNLGSNAVKFSPARSIVSVLLQRRGEYLELIVRDNGVGIPADKIRYIGQPFYQVQQATSRKPGSGLGVAIVKKLAERLGGEFALESTAGVGTRALVRLPLLRVTDEPARTRAAA